MRLILRRLDRIENYLKFKSDRQFLKVEEETQEAAIKETETQKRNS